MQVLIALLAVLCLTAGAYALFLLARLRRDREVTFRLDRLISESPVAAKAQASLGIWPDSTRLLPAVARNRLYQAGIEISADRLTALLVFGLCSWVALSIVFGLLAATIVLLSVSLVLAAIVDYRARQRMNALSDAMLGYFDRIRQLLVVGNSLSVALARATQSSPPSVAEFFQATVRRIA